MAKTAWLASPRLLVTEKKKTVGVLMVWAIGGAYPHL